MFSSIINYIFHQPKPKSENFYYLSLLKNDNNVYGYSIHGLWPNFGNGTYPSFCKKLDFNITKLDSIKKDLINYWELPEDKNIEEVKFWKHEWLKHGSCMFEEMDELEYFKKAIDLYLMLIKNDKINIDDYKIGKTYMIPFDLNFELIAFKKK